MSIILETKEVTKTFKAQHAVHDVSFHIEEGSIYGLLGPNGAGKSTLLKMITGMLQPSAGTILFEGKQWSRSALNNIGSLIESPPVYGNLTAWENLKVRTTLLGLPSERIDEVLALVDLTNTGKKRAKHFSLGMKQRLGIALTLVNNPKLLILDEPMNGLDPVGIQELRALIQSFAKQGITVVVSSHILSEIEQIADHIGIMVDGQLVYEESLHAEADLEALFMKVCLQKKVS